MSWFVYMVEARTGELYTGVTTDPDRRVSEHNVSDRGARWCKARRPVALVWLEEAEGRSEAQRREAAVRRLKRVEKLDLVAECKHPLLAKSS